MPNMEPPEIDYGFSFGHTGKPDLVKTYQYVEQRNWLPFRVLDSGGVVWFGCKYVKRVQYYSFSDMDSYKLPGETKTMSVGDALAEKLKGDA